MAQMKSQENRGGSRERLMITNTEFSEKTSRRLETSSGAGGSQPVEGRCSIQMYSSRIRLAWWRMCSDGRERTTGGEKRKEIRQEGESEGTGEEKQDPPRRP